jgi:dUTP pyrophosphatase
MSRGFEKVSTYDQVHLPRRATKLSAAYDLYSAAEVTIEAGQMGQIPTGIKAYFENDEVLYLYSRSSFPIKYGLILPNSVGVIDADYYNNSNNEGELFLLVYNITNYPVTVPQNERIAQAVFAKVFRSDDDLMNDEVRRGGFGSTKG